MNTYTVKAGDNLTKIAIKIFAKPNKWREIADLNSIPPPFIVKPGQVLQLMPKMNIPAVVPAQPPVNTPANNQPVPIVTPVSQDAEITISGTSVFYRFSGTTEKIFLGKVFKKGLFRPGSFNTEHFINNNAALLATLSLSNSEINTLLATSQNEGNLDAINTWDNSYLSWGMFQWTMGQQTDAGELAALLKLLKEKQPAAFKSFFGDFGIDIAPSTGSETGFITLNNVVQNTDARKTAFRNHNWALRFALAGKEPAVCAVQVLHAINRYNTFYFDAGAGVEGFSLNQLLSSEYAASLLLDQHVNRPGHVKPVVAAALTQAGITAQQLAHGSDADELKVINKYLAIRKIFGRSPMTNSDTRAKVVQQFLNNGKISAAKGSFISNRNQR